MGALTLTSLKRYASGLREAAGECIPDPRTCAVLEAAQRDVPMRKQSIKSGLSGVFYRFPEV